MDDTRINMDNSLILNAAGNNHLLAPLSRPHNLPLKVCLSPASQPKLISHPRPRTNAVKSGLS